MFVLCVYSITILFYMVCNPQPGKPMTHKFDSRPSNARKKRNNLSFNNQMPTSITSDMYIVRMCTYSFSPISKLYALNNQVITQLDLPQTCNLHVCMIRAHLATGCAEILPSDSTYVLQK